MASYTPNYHLSKPDASDPSSDFRQSYNDNMDIIDQIGGGGGGGSYVAGDGIKIQNSVISLAYLTVIDGAVNLVFDDGT